ncbi:hypothetical protein [Deinococcus soli (ex Cha et al. 2016)]|uniref:Superfamily II DNA or RNA helicase n=2 Tax=Deinococcus soli (ex Cha et al. 2016) TaxID=1309411 RepID=A0ACC6KH81_9DEIO|nr:hypothetical protein [Deinococcus soli (ex Cha et al. 2016)]MDR6218929.1 superfamily II DNA or RNA helicase [Deinococcus soli (ex Cha et al. 2016)]MDR6328726.1 superfamily II DNA or RNA helicase [Deinococcus soli (ex Cha et al. 2016)]MDR6751787.1 superfamily II DNA or RNA helicase [Deinococcus soli (ex Cha et al. 2016)]
MTHPLPARRTHMKAHHKDPHALADEYARSIQKRRTLALCNTGAIADVFARVLTKKGVAAEQVSPRMGARAIHAALSRFRSGETQVIACASLLMHGFDTRAADTLLLARHHPDSDWDDLVARLCGVSKPPLLILARALNAEDITRPF